MQSIASAPSPEAAGGVAPTKFHQPLTRQQSLEKLKALLEMEVTGHEKHTQDEARKCSS